MWPGLRPARQGSQAPGLAVPAPRDGRNGWVRLDGAPHTQLTIYRDRITVVDERCGLRANAVSPPRGRPRWGNGPVPPRGECHTTLRSPGRSTAPPAMDPRGGGGHAPPRTPAAARPGTPSPGTTWAPSSCTGEGRQDGQGSRGQGRAAPREVRGQDHAWRAEILQPDIGAVPILGVDQHVAHVVRRREHLHETPGREALPHVPLHAPPLAAVQVRLDPNPRQRAGVHERGLPVLSAPLGEATPEPHPPTVRVSHPRHGAVVHDRQVLPPHLPGWQHPFLRRPKVTTDAPATQGSP